MGRALALWSGPAFAEFAGEAWAVPEVARLEELRLVAMELLAGARLAQGRASAAVPDLDRLLHDHPLREGAIALLVSALYRSGRQADALGVLARARRRLADELGVDPGPQLRALERDVLDQAEHILAPVGLPAAPLAAPAAPPGLLGRTRELARLQAVARRAIRGVQLVLVSCDAGGGKTTLLDVFRVAQAAAGWTTALGRCPEADGAPPGWAWREVVEEVLAAHPADPALLARLDNFRTGSGPSAPEQTFWLARAMVDLLTGAAVRERPLLLVLDDLHRADGQTLQLLRSVVEGTGGHRC